MSRQLMIAEVLSQPQAVSWLPWAVQYFFFIGIAACAALLACVWRWRGGDNAAHLERMALFIGLTCAITAPLALTADLHQTARFWHFYAYPTPRGCRGARCSCRCLPCCLACGFSRSNLRG